MKNIILCLFVFVLLPTQVFAKEVADGNLLNFFVGTYNIVGKSYESNQTYLGEVDMAIQGKSLKVTRRISGKKIIGKGFIELTVVGDPQEVLRIRFKEANSSYEETCLWHGDLDNYARITCYLYRPEIQTENPGLEAYFIKQEPW